MFTTLFARAILALSGHRICCEIPGWTAHVGQSWDTFDVAPWNLYNVIWRTVQWAERQVWERAARL